MFYLAVIRELSRYVYLQILSLVFGWWEVMNDDPSHQLPLLTNGVDPRSFLLVMHLTTRHVGGYFYIYQLSHA